MPKQSTSDGQPTQSSRAAGGAGLGLSIVHDMVERSYGTITVQARPGGGTIFTVRFPHFDLEEDET